MVRAHLPAVDGVFLAHPLLDERMPRLRHHRLAAAAGHDVHRVPRQPRVVNDFRPRLLLQERFRQQTDNVVPLDKRRLVIEQEAAVEVAVKGDTHVRLMCTHRVGGVLAALRQQRVRDTVREMAVRLVMHLDKGHRRPGRREAFLHLINHVPRRPVAGVHHQLQRTGEVRQVHVAHQVVDVLLQHRYLAQGSATRRVHRRELVLLRQALDIPQAGVAADGLRVLAHQLHAVVVHRVMARRHLDAAVHPEVEGGEVNLFGAAQADIQHVGAGVHQPAGQRQLQRLAGEAHIAPHHYLPGFQKFAIGAADTVGNVLVQLLAQFTTDVISLKAC
ncbi:Uncharacterised protein [Klebsiella variicola]|nr:Uncharacterised protein [Klebsiella variicola]